MFVVSLILHICLWYWEYWKICRDVALPIRWPLLSCIIPTLFAYFLACHPYIFLHFQCFLFFYFLYIGTSALFLVQVGDFSTNLLSYNLFSSLSSYVLLASQSWNHFRYEAEMQSKKWFLPLLGADVVPHGEAIMMSYEWHWSLCPLELDNYCQTGEARPSQVVYKSILELSTGKRILTLYSHPLVQYLVQLHTAISQDCVTLYIT